ncbi:MAG: ABC transporter ATP-binding protein [Deltaproteobacteria bacterium]|nr:ABC transporter ATP-binding protein [bacterium]MCB9476047.1 ABC transporter ATP-binding protein [Deltaproteobacteria bacterium]MCB9478264.1 ABC transporter ATP-binding protein [Deltaproteobacteria bacterium]MCB9487184.1 ABC transporter ATP-binding protein [Deltaproteobacteria bacterium]
MIEVRDLVKIYHQGAVAVHALRGVSFRVEPGEFLGITGPSGSGKSTILNCLGGLDDPTSGEVIIDGTPIGGLSDNERTLLRRRKIGFIFQFFNLLPTMSALDNVALPMLLDGRSRAKVYERAASILNDVGLGHRMTHRPDELSGGEQQRVAVARALAFDPVVILADEPTGNLDSKSSAVVMEFISDLATKHGKAVILVTHDPFSLGFARRVIRVADGHLVSDDRQASA